MSGWPQTALGDLLVDATSGFACGEEVKDGVFQFRMNNITVEGQLDLSKRRRVPSDYRNIDRFSLRPGDVLFNATNSRDLVGKTAYFPGLKELAVFSNHFLRLRPRGSELDGRFLSRWLNLEFQRGRFKGMCRKWVNQATVGRDALLPMKIPLPPLPEQRRIAAILDKADALRAKRRAALAQLDTLTQSIFLDMFGDPATNPKRWQVKRISDVLNQAEIFTDGDWVESKDQDPAGEVRLIQLADIGDGQYLDKSARFLTRETAIRLKCTFLKAGDVLLARMPDPLGRACIFPGDVHEAVTVVDVCVIRPAVHGPEPIWLAQAFNTTGFRGLISREATGTTRERISRGNLSKLRLIVPPRDLQVEFCRIDAEVERQKAMHKRDCKAFDDLFASLQHRAFRGEL